MKNFKVMIEELKTKEAKVVLWDERLSTFHAKNQMTEVGIKRDKQRKKKR